MVVLLRSHPRAASRQPSKPLARGHPGDGRAPWRLRLNSPRRQATTVVMRAVVQRVARAKVTVSGRVTGAIDAGLLVLLGAGQGDTAADLAYVVDKIANLRIFADAAGKMNRSVLDLGGGVLVVSQFTLYGDARQGRRPAFTGALEPVAARALYEQALVGLRLAGVAQVQAGEFAADMAVELTNDGPVTILLDSRKAF
jgi:D-tyrosyl-tRNA(Tyr) deacylase